MSFRFHYSTGGNFDLQSALSKLNFSTTGIPNELHYIDPFSGTVMNFEGPGTSLFGEDGRPARLNPDGTPMPHSVPKNSIDELSRQHDLAYHSADITSTDPSEVLAENRV